MSEGSIVAIVVALISACSSLGIAWLTTRAKTIPVEPRSPVNWRATTVTTARWTLRIALHGLAVCVFFYWLWLLLQPGRNNVPYHLLGAIVSGGLVRAFAEYVWDRTAAWEAKIPPDRLPHSN
jgi:hypothetical protein